MNINAIKWKMIQTFPTVQYAVHSPTHMVRCPDAGLIVGHRLRRWPTINPASCQHTVLAGKRWLFVAGAAFTQLRAFDADVNCYFILPFQRGDCP